MLANRYEILNVLGTGGMGSVYKAKDLELDRLVALKVIRPELARNTAIVDRFKQELRLSHKVTHRNVVRLYDLSEDAGMRFVTMELVARAAICAAFLRSAGSCRQTRQWTSSSRFAWRWKPRMEWGSFTAI